MVKTDAQKLVLFKGKIRTANDDGTYDVQHKNDYSQERSVSAERIRAQGDWLAKFKAGEKNLAGADFRGREISNADFSDCDLDGADFSGATLDKCKFPKKMKDVSFCQTVSS